VSRLTLLFFGAAKDIPEAAETVTAGTVRLALHFANERPTWPVYQTAARPLKKCATNDISAMINRM